MVVIFGPFRFITGDGNAFRYMLGKLKLDFHLLLIFIMRLMTPHEDTRYIMDCHQQ